MLRRRFCLRLAFLGMIGAGLLVGLDPVPAQTLRAEEPEAWQAAQLEKLKGQWVSAREQKSSAGVRRYDRFLRFTDGTLSLCVAEEGMEKSPGFVLTLVRVEQAEGAARLCLSAETNFTGEFEAIDKRRASLVYYAFDGDKLIVVGNCPRVRPFESGPLSGEYHRVEQPQPTPSP